MDEDGGITITGIDEALAALDNVSAKIGKEYMAKALVAASVPVFQAIKAETPQRTGDLAGSLQTTVTLSADGKGGSSSIGFSKQWAHLAGWIERGFHLTGHKPQKKLIKDIAPKPFMRIGAETARQEAIEAFTNSLNESLETQGK